MLGDDNCVIRLIKINRVYTKDKCNMVTNRTNGRNVAITNTNTFSETTDGWVFVWTALTE